MALTSKKCVPCEGGVPALDARVVCKLLPEIPGWQLDADEGQLHKRYKFASFVENIAFISRMAALAEQEGHHPDFCVQYDVLDVTLSTHAIDGLSENDFILAAKIDQLL
jgi:4a-hydroxytetrahydrobiopterin dehydratase